MIKSRGNSSVSTKTGLKKVPTMIKKLLDPKLQKLYRVGFINGDLEPTDEGINELLNILFLDNTDALVEVAKDRIKQASKAKDEAENEAEAA